MNLYRQSDWDASVVYPRVIEDPYLMRTGVILDENTKLQPGGPPHRHPEVMLAWCYRGTVTMQLRDTVLSLAPGQGVWIPAFTPHAARHERGSVGCYTYLPESAIGVGEVSRVLVPRAVQEMLLHLGVNDMDDALRVRIQSVLIEMLQTAVPEPVASEIPMPSDERVLALVAQVLAEPGSPDTVRELCEAHGLHERTVLRIFHAETGMSFRQWRAGVRMSLAARLIAEGAPISAAAYRSGYATTSAFSAAFKAWFGVTPREYVLRAQSESARQLYWR